MKFESLFLYTYVTKHLDCLKKNELTQVLENDENASNNNGTI